jgi:hypothetical protein
VEESGLKQPPKTAPTQPRAGTDSRAGEQGAVSDRPTPQPERRVVIRHQRASVGEKLIEWLRRLVSHLTRDVLTG